MDELNSVVSDQLNKINQLEECVNICLRRENIYPEIKTLENKMSDVKELIYNSNQMIGNHQTMILNEYEKVMKKLRDQQITIMNIMEEIEKRPKLLRPTKKNPIVKFELSPAKTPKRVLDTPRMYLSEYEKSPYIAKIKPISLQFIDFEANITAEKFNEIPKYMRGRETAEELQQFMETVINPCFTEKYQLLHRKRECIRNLQDLELWKKYRQQASCFPGHKFITQEDISRKTEKAVDKKMGSRLVMLRHLGIIYEQRQKSVIFYLWGN